MVSEKVLQWLLATTPAKPWSFARSLAFAVAMVALALLARMLIDPLLGNSSPYGFFLLAVVAIGFYGGGFVAAAAAVVSLIVSGYFFTAPRHDFATAFSLNSTSYVFLFLAAILTAAGVMMRTAVSALRARQYDLELNAERSRQIADLSPQIVWSARRSGMLDYYNKRWFEFSGADPAMAPTGWDPYVHPDDVEESKTRWAHALKTGEDYEAEMRLLRKDGAYRWFLARALPFRSPAGAIERWFGSCTDIHDSKTAISDLRRLSHQLEQSEGRFRQIADLLPQMVWSTPPDGRTDYFNSRWYEFTGVPHGSTEGDAWSSVFHPDDQKRAIDTWAQAVATGTPYEIEYRLRRADGEYLWFLGRGLAMRDENGEIVRWFGTCTDIHDRKMALAMQETLSHELSHRIKNIFAVVTSLVSLSVRNEPQAAPFAGQLRKRLDALGRAHDFARPHSDASRPHVPDPTIFALVRVLMEPYAAESGDRLTISGEDIDIADRVATPIALIVHELATNATKYGALSVPDGQVFISGARVDDQYELVWREQGGPPVSAPGGALGFGSRLLDVSAGGQLGGEVERAWDADGVKVTIRVPLSSLARDAAPAA